MMSQIEELGTVRWIMPTHKHGIGIPVIETSFNSSIRVGTEHRHSRIEAVRCLVRP